LGIFIINQLDHARLLIQTELKFLAVGDTTTA
jgi:hypothetical protein